MPLISSICASARRRCFFENVNNLRRALTCIMCNNYPVKKLSTHNVRYFSTKDCKETSTEKTEIYHGTLTRQIRTVKLFSLVTSTGGLTAQPFFFAKAIETGNTSAIVGTAIIGLLALTTPLLIHFVTKKYVTYLYYDAKEDKYIANTYSLFTRTKELVFTPDDVVVPDVTGMFTNCIIKGRPLFLQQELFYDSAHYIRIMGYDKPVDFKLSTNNDCNPRVAVNAEYKDHVNKK